MLCLAWLVPAMARSRALQGQVWFLSTVGHPWVVHSGAQEMAVTQMVSSPPWPELCWKLFDPSCQVGMWFAGAEALPVLRASLPRGCVRGSLSSARAGGQDQPLRIIVGAAMSWQPCFPASDMWSCWEPPRGLAQACQPHSQSDEGLTWQHWARGLQLSSDGARLS